MPAANGPASSKKRRMMSSTSAWIARILSSSAWVVRGKACTATAAAMECPALHDRSGGSVKEHCTTTFRRHKH